MNYIAVDRASEAAANDLAEVRKLIEGMNALVNSQMQQQQQQLQHAEYPNLMQQQQQQQDAAALMATIASVAQQNDHNSQLPTPPAVSNNDPPTLPTATTNQANINNNINNNNNTLHTPEQSPQPTTPAINNNDTTSTEVTSPATNAETNTSSLQQTETQIYSNPAPQAGVIIEVTHLSYNRTLYFQLTHDATIEPMIAWLRLSFTDSAISGMVLQYKGFDGLWKCLLNRDDSLRRILKQSMKGNTMLQMRVPREQDLLTSGYTDRRLLALTKSDTL